MRNILVLFFLSSLLNLFFFPLNISVSITHWLFLFVPVIMVWIFFWAVSCLCTSIWYCLKNGAMHTCSICPYITLNIYVWIVAQFCHKCLSSQIFSLFLCVCIYEMVFLKLWALIFFISSQLFSYKWFLFLASLLHYSDAFIHIDTPHLWL